MSGVRPGVYAFGASASRIGSVNRAFDQYAMAIRRTGSLGPPQRAGTVTGQKRVTSIGEPDGSVAAS